MSWYGIHPTVPRAEVKVLCPPATCRWCIYWLQVVVIRDDADGWWYENPLCVRCGIDKQQVARKVLAHLRKYNERV